VYLTQPTLGKFAVAQTSPLLVWDIIDPPCLHLVAPKNAINLAKGGQLLGLADVAGPQQGGASRGEARGPDRPVHEPN
jgi:hypothetical protein